ncbi:MAG TPA: hypothetical protein VK781_13195, partial [Solirubrobacteraceae bacterium]|nr:hypothetical protein [Solirubrobacteraceae bacterium]
RGLFRLLRNRALLLTLSFGPRVRSVSGLRIEDLLEDYSHPDLPGITAALRLFPDKKSQPLERLDSVLKPLPADALVIYRSLLAFYRVVFGELARDTPLFLTYLAVFTGDHNRQRGLTTDGIRCLLSGTRKTSRPVRALLPQGKDPYIGFTPHNVRAAACQLLQHAGAREWCEAHLIDPARCGAMAEALLDHFLDANMVALYGGDTTTPGRERLSGWATSIICELLLGDLGARKQPDLVAYRATVRRQGQLERELTALQRQIGDLRASAAVLAREGEKLDAVLLLTLEVGALEDKRWQLTQEGTALQARVDALEQRSNWRSVPDTVETVERVDFAGLRCVPIDIPISTKPRRRVPARDWLTRNELADIAGCSTTTITRWVRDGIPKSLIRKARSPWTPGQPPIVAFNPKRRAFWIPGLNRAVLFDTHRKRDALLEALLAQPPLGWRSSPTKVPTADRPQRFAR